jgi:hypothetical protein
MSKRMMLFALVATSALFALPAAASAQEAHLEGITAFTGTAAAGIIAATGEEPITCESVDFTNGVVNAGGTTGSLGLDFTGCHSTVLGITAKCRTTGSALDNTILSSAVFHIITINNKPGFLFTPASTTIVCAGLSSTTLQGSFIATITSPACGVESKSLTAAFSATGTVQNHKSYTGINYNLTLQTSGGSKVEAGITYTATLNSTTAGKVNCT